MLFSDYIKAVAADAAEVIGYGEYDHCETVEDVMDDLWIDDAVTGNGSGSYTFNTAAAAENVADLVWDPDFSDALADICADLGALVKDGPEAVDVTARCLALGYAYADIEAAWDERREIIEAEA